MYDIEELEKKWIKYRRRKIAIVVSSTILTISTIGGVSYLIVNSDKLKSSNKEIAKREVIAKDKDVILKRANGDEQEYNRADIKVQNGNYNLNSSYQVQAKKPELNLIITSPKSGTVVKEIEQRFKESKNYDDAIYLAEYYYSHKNYKKAEYWAMQANIVDSIPEDSWILFAKAKVKSGHRLEALKVLEAYYNKTGSTNALDLIDAIRKNRKF